jgi:hypothetical protein
MRRVGNFSILLSLVILLAQALPATAAVKVRLSHNPVRLNEPFELTIESTGEKGGTPDLSDIRAHFEVIDQATSQTLRVINGQASHRGELRLTLMPRHTGELKIPPITVGDQRSEPILIQVLEPDPNDVMQGSDKVFLEVGTDRESVLVQAQVLYTVRIYRSAQLADLRLSPPRTKGPYTVVEQLGESRDYRETVNGIVYQVSELRYALFPQTPGLLTIEPAEVTAFEMEQPRGAYSYFSRPRAGRRISVRSEPLDLTVKPVPAKAPSRPWLPATKLQLAEAWPESDPKLRVGKPVTRTLMVLADGLPAAKLPPLEPEYPEGLKTYTENATLENRTSAQGMTGVRQERTTLVPTREGFFELPAIEIHWWSTKDNRGQVARLPARRIEVLAPVPEPVSAPKPPATLAQPQYPLIAPPPSTWTPRSPPATEMEPSGPGVTAAPKRSAPWTLWLASALAIGWLATAVAWWRSRRRAAHQGTGTAGIDRGLPQPQPPSSPGLQALQQACLHGDRHAAQVALLTWGHEVWPDQAVTSLGALAALTPPDLGREIQTLDRALYGSTGTGWDCAALWAALTRFHVTARSGSTLPDETLTPLNPNI